MYQMKMKAISPILCTIPQFFQEPWLVFQDRSDNSLGWKVFGIGFFFGLNQKSQLMFMVYVGLLESLMKIHQALVNAWKVLSH